MTARDASYVADMLLYARRVVSHMDGVDRARLAADPLVQDAVVRALSVIGEAAAHVGTDYRDAHPTIPWRGIVGMRNVLVHDYTDINLDAVWAAAAEEVPALIPALEALVREAEQDADPDPAS